MQAGLLSVGSVAYAGSESPFEVGKTPLPSDTLSGWTSERREITSSATMPYHVSNNDIQNTVTDMYELTIRIEEYAL